MKERSIIMKNSSRFFIGLRFNRCSQEAGKRIILIGPSVFGMEMYGDLFTAIRVHLQVPERLVLRNAHLYGRLIGRGVRGAANVTFMPLDVSHTGEIFILQNEGLH